MAKPGLLLIYPYMEYMAGLISDRFDLLKLWEESDPDKAIAERGAGVVAILTTGNEKIDGALMDRLPGLKVIVAVGAGYGGIVVPEARKRGITVTNAGDTHSADVADHAVGMLLGLVQKLRFNDDYVRDGEWLAKGFPKHRPSMSAQRFGILGLGRIGRAVGDRLAPFGGEIAWWGPNDREAPWPRLSSPLELARWCSVLIVACRGDAGQLVPREVVDAVGENGYIVNVARGAVIDEQAMIDALNEGRLAGVGLDVFETEPLDPQRWAGVPNAILSPHAAGLTIEAMDRLREAAATNLKTALDGGAVLNEIFA
jgi:lactate dehydrogenase-like 2-hydroxyacid dehydrogenase